ncbi:hypothetical protein [Bradyrhizobium sp. BRP22]|uniref:hypothetical protein n=1 Tax=Bradyrhizobium sp. BRP22 TaxID=2793821 RepID=UPI001CD6320F|nr:hypothetical protein [Bradyrhizobium sp. BRP22]
MVRFSNDQQGIDRARSAPSSEQPRYRALQTFSHLSGSFDRGQRRRPLGLVSNFVTDQLPHCIAEIKCSERPDEAVKALGRSINAMIASADYDGQLLNLPDPDFAVPKTDVQYLVNCAYQMSAFARLDAVQAELTVGEALSRLARLSCQRRPSIEVLSYEDAILTNPLQSDPRVYCLGPAGVEERDFCLGHQLIESELKLAIAALLELRDAARADAHQCLALCLERLEAAHYFLTRFFEHMSPDLFGQFRVFYGKNPYKNRLGPSGRFSARIVAVSVLLVGEELFQQKPQFYRDLYRLSEYYPQGGIHEVFRCLSPDKSDTEPTPSWLEGKADFPRFATISPVIERCGGEIRRLRATCICALEQFTRLHRTTALKYTVEPGRPTIGVEASESLEAVLSQRLLTAARPSPTVFG